MLPDSSTRLNKYISESGICSRREADRFIEQGNVFIKWQARHYWRSGEAWRFSQSERTVD
ncbi:ribosomal large subunit pseudouridine synthase F [Klebsiella pneumoniae]|uniref:Ribosomal large subunit pseudouridine synthase F n=1 Tax=Klebsiella pneumoniae TaxID=573 RepID=A0A2X3EV52_KLEPN|nr:ribosomal large subunit pseudouridine synthase F [Klebsiella pneumoniae]